MRSGPSLTARAVALARSELQRPRSPAGDADAEQRLYAGLRMPARWPLGASLRRWVAARTAFFDGATLAAIDRGVAQIVIVGAGYDGRALRFASPGVDFFEVDHPSTQRDKRRRVEQLQASVDGVAYIAHDLTQGELGAELAAAGHDRERPSLFLCEGLLLYLDTAVAEKLLRELRATAPSGSQLAISAREELPASTALGTVRRTAQRLLLAAIGEPRRSLFAVGELHALLDKSGWSVVAEQVDVGAHSGSRGVLLLAEPAA